MTEQESDKILIAQVPARDVEMADLYMFNGTPDEFIQTLVSDYVWATAGFVGGKPIQAMYTQSLERMMSYLFGDWAENLQIYDFATDIATIHAEPDHWEMCLIEGLERNHKPITATTLVELCVKARKKAKYYRITRQEGI